jgi:hypothetical protein
MPATTAALVSERVQPAIMKVKRFIYVGLVLGCIMFGCHIAWQQHAKSFLARLHPPGADQVKKWLSLSESTHLTMLTNLPDYPLDNQQDDMYPGKFKWLRAYEDRKGSNFNTFVIAVYESGSLWPNNRAKFIRKLEQTRKKMLEDQTKAKLVHDKEANALVEAMAPITMPNGKKSYGFLLGFFPGRFAFHPEFDVFAFEFGEPMSYDERHRPAETTETPTISFYEFFTNVDAFLSSQ